MGIRDMFKKKPKEMTEKEKNESASKYIEEDENKIDGIKNGLKNQLKDDKASKSSNDDSNIDSEILDKLREKAGDAYKL
jgi:hypothetical protein